MANINKIWCETTKRNYWVTNINVGGAITIVDLLVLVSDFKKQTDSITSASIKYDKIDHSSRYKGYGYIFSNNRNQLRCADSISVEDGFNYIHS